MSTIRTADEKQRLVFLILAFAAVYVIWGSTYLAIKYAIETLPTFLMAGVRFLIAGGILYGAARLSRGYEKPRAVHWRTSFIVGALLLVVGNGAVVMAEHYVSSSMAALLVASNPFWMVTLGWLFMGHGKPNFKVTLGLIVGFIGVAMLIFSRPDAGGVSSEYQWLGIILVVIATIAWAFGSLYGANAPIAKSNVLAAGMQMLAGGLMLTVISALTGEWQTFDYQAVSASSWLALAYLIFVGALVAYTAYSWLIQNASPTAVSTPAYVNPVVAILLGWAIASESLNAQMLIGAAVIVVSVILVTSNNKRKVKIEEIDIHNSLTPTSKTSSATA